jgi:hypothetical protein
MTQAADSSTGPDRQALKDAFSPADVRSTSGSHPKETFLSGLAVVLAAVGAALIGFPSLHILGGWVALTGIVVGLYAQLTSATTGERMVNVVAIGVAAVAFAFHIQHGGLF